MQAHDLYFKRANGDKVALSQWNMAILQAPIALPKVKALTNISYADKDGVDEFVPNEMMLESYVQEFKIAYKGESMASAHTAINNLFNYLTTGGMFSWFCNYIGYGRQNCRIEELSVSDQNYSSTEVVVEMNLKIKVNDPRTILTAL